MSIAEILSGRAEEFALPGDFRTVGEPALLVTNETTPADFFTDVRSAFAPDGYVYGPGCGNILAMVEAFPGTPRGLVLVDVDPAVVWAGKIVVAGLSRHDTAEGFVGEVFCGGPEALERIQEEVLAAEASAVLVRQMRSQRERLRKSFAVLTAGFSLGPADAGRLLAEWASYYPPQGTIVPVRTFVARNYAKLRDLARRGDIAVLPGSIFDPRLIAAVAALPGFAGARNLLYLSNVTDHVLRRALLAHARSKLRLHAGGDGAGRELRSTEEFLDFLNGEQVGQLRALTDAGRETVFVESSTLGGLVLTSHTDFPVYAAGDFNLDFNLDRLIVHFFEALTGWSRQGKGEGPAWNRARRLRALLLGLYSAAVRGAADRARETFGILEAELAHRDLLDAPGSEGADAAFAAFWVAELAHALLMVRRSPVAGDLVFELEAMQDRLDAAAAGLLARRDEVAAVAAGRPAHLLLAAQAFTLSGHAEAGRSFLADALALQAADGLFAEGEAAGAAVHAEALLRLVLGSLHTPDEALGRALTGATVRMLRFIRPNGELELGAAPAGGGYAAYLGDPETVSENVRLGLLLYGVSAQEGSPIEAALQVDYQLRHRNAAATPDADVLMGDLG
ncbi:MAG TPA: hypothetical protein VKK31_07720 [Thermoanaerobaculia bacterium]|nr:hypothetical protein [Thermoanaerobaculia bacterium]